MKKLMFIMLIALTGYTASAQQSQLNSVFNQYSGQEGFTSIYITKYMFELFAKIADEGDQDVQDVKSLTKGLSGIKILTMSGKNDSKRESFYTDTKKALSNPYYQDFMIINDEGTEIIFKLRDEGERITELVMLVEDAQEPVLLFMQGDIDLASVAKMSQSMNVKGFEHLDKVDQEEE